MTYSQKAFESIWVNLSFFLGAAFLSLLVLRAVEYMSKTLNYVSTS